MSFSAFDELFDTSGGSVSITSNFISLALWVLLTVALWKIYGKAGEPGWASIVPYYRSYILYKISGKKNLFWGYLACSIVTIVAGAVFFGTMIALIVASLEGNAGNEAVPYAMGMMGAVFVLLICAIVMLVFRILQSIGLAKCFGLSGGYAVGLIFLPHIFYCIVAFSSNIFYRGEDGYYANNPYGMPYGYNPQYGQPQYNQQPYGQPQYIDPQYSQPQYSDPRYSQPQYNQPQYNTSEYPQPSAGTSSACSAPQDENNQNT